MAILNEFEQAYNAEQEKMKWSHDATEHEKTLVAGNCHRLAFWAARWMLQRCLKEISNHKSGGAYDKISALAKGLE